MASFLIGNPIRDMNKFNWDYDRFFQEFMEPEWAEFSEEGYSYPPVESYYHEGNFVIKVELPGVMPQDVHLTAEQGRLTIEGERKRGEDVPEGSLVREELCYGPFRRSITIPDGVKTDQCKAKYHDGILEITAPVEGHHPSKKIEVQVEESKTIPGWKDTALAAI